MSLDPFSSILSGGYIGTRFDFRNYPLNSSFHLFVCPCDIAHKRLAILVLYHIGIEDLVTFKIGNVIICVLDGHRAGRGALSKRHGHRGHDAAEAQRRCEAGGYCQACDVLAHAHLLFLCFLLEFHLIGHHLSVS